MPQKQTIYLWIDFTSPYAYLAYANLKKAISESKRKDLIINLKSYQIEPDLNPFDGNKLKALKKRLKNEKKIFETPKISAMVKTVGLRFEFKEVEPINTIHPHRLLQLAKTYDDDFVLANDLARVLFLNYWSKNKNISLENELLKISNGAGMDEKVVNSVFNSDKYLDMVFLDEQEAIAADVQGVPFFFLPNKTKLSGVPTIEQLKKLLKEIKPINE